MLENRCLKCCNDTILLIDTSASVKGVKAHQRRKLGS